MWIILFQAIAIASAGIVAFGSLTLVILLLTSEHGWGNGLSYMSGYTLSYMLMGIGGVILGSGINSGLRETVSFAPAFLILGVFLGILGLRNLYKPDDEPGSRKPSLLFLFADRLNPLSSFFFGITISIINIKNLVIFLSAIAVIRMGDIELPSKVLIAVLVALIFCLSVIVPVCIYVIVPRRSDRILGAIKSLVDKNRRVVGILVPLVFSILFILKGAIELL
jgi:threonine/homoserine/homoserine lactone efflux protein